MQMTDQQPPVVVEVEQITPEEQAQRVADRLQRFGASLAKQRDEWVRARAATGVDKRWAEDLDQYHARDSANRAAAQMMTSVEQGYPVTANGAQATRSTVYISLTRQKTNAAESRLADILLPTDDRNWGIQPTPDHRLSAQMQDERPAIDPASGQPMTDRQGQPLRRRDIAAQIQDMARRRAEGMQNRIDDQLTECDYNGELRKMIHDAAVLGTGVVKGPIVTNRTRRAWRRYVDAAGDATHMLEMVEERTPATYRVDPRRVFPDPACGEDIHNGKGLFECDLLTARQVRELAKQPGYVASQVARVLEEGPQKTTTIDDSRTRREQMDAERDNFEVWEYWGELDKEDLIAAGVDIDPDDELASVSGCVVLINSTVVKAFLNPLDTGDIPYDFFVWEKASDSVWGYGIPYLMRAQQRVLNAAWRQMMDNAGVSSGPQVIVNPAAITPADKRWEITGRKLWWAADEGVDVSKAFAVVQIDSRQGELANIIELAMKLADDETGVPQLVQGERGTAPDTVGGMQMLMNAANVVLRRLVKQFDDSVTRPHIRRYYDFNMLYAEDEDIKGDFNVDARGSSALIIRDIQNQAYLNLLAAATNPAFAPLIKQRKLFEAALKAQHIDPTEIVKTEDEIEREQAAAAKNPQPADPRIAAAQIKAQAEVAKAQSQAEADRVEMDTRMQLAQQDHAAKMAALQLEREVAMLRLAAERELSLEQIKAQLADTAIKERAKKELFAAEAHLKATTGQGI